MSVIPLTNPAHEAEVLRLTTLYELLRALTRAEVLEDVYEAALNSLLTVTAADRAAILAFDPDGIIRFKAWRDLSPEYREAVTGQTPWRHEAQNAQLIAIPDVLIDENLRPYREIFAREQIRALASIALSLDAGVLGEFVLYYADPHECTQDELALAQVIRAM